MAEMIVGQFVHYFLNKEAPNIQVALGDQTFDARELYNKAFIVTDSGEFEVPLEEGLVELRYNVSRTQKSGQFKKHSLLFVAANRVVGSPRDITDLVGASSFQSADGKPYILTAQVFGDFLDDAVDDSRTKLQLSPEDIGAIVKAVGQIILRQENENRDKINERKAATVSKIISINPMLRIGLSGETIGQYASTKPNNWDEVRFIQDLSVKKHRIEKGWFGSIDRFIEEKGLDGSKYQDVFDNLDDIRKNSLAQYVLHRQKVIDVTDKFREIDDDGKYKKEDVMHDLIMRRNKDTTELGILDLNLWMIDDRLSFVSYVSSDRATKGAGRPKGSKIPDLVFYDDGMILGEKSGSHTLLVEFKKPDRDDYSFGRSGYDPVQQVIDTAQYVRDKEEIVDLQGKTHPLKPDIPMYAYIIADIKPSLRDVLRKHDFNRNWDSSGFYKYQNAFKVFIEVISYDKMIHDARVRNLTFFEILMGDLTVPAEDPTEKQSAEEVDTEEA